MMPETYLAYLVAATTIILLPGPTNLIVVSSTLRAGPRRSMWVIAGVVVTQPVLMVLASLGLAAVMSVSAHAFEILRWIGGAYLIGLGLVSWFRNPEDVVEGADPIEVSKAGLFLQGAVVNSTNPKALIFWAGFLPPFLNPEAALVPQLIILGSTFSVIFILVALGHVVLAARVRPWFRDARRLRLQRRISGSLLMGAGVLMLAPSRK